MVGLARLMTNGVDHGVDEGSFVEWRPSLDHRPRAHDDVDDHHGRPTAVAFDPHVLTLKRDRPTRGIVKGDRAVGTTWHAPLAPTGGSRRSLQEGLDPFAGPRIMVVGRQHESTRPARWSRGRHKALGRIIHGSTRIPPRDLHPRGGVLRNSTDAAGPGRDIRCRPGTDRSTAQGASRPWATMSRSP